MPAEWKIGSLLRRYIYSEVCRWHQPSQLHWICLLPLAFRPCRQGEIFVLFHGSIPSATGYKNVSLEPKMCWVAKVGAINDNLASCKNLDLDLACGRNYPHGNLMSVSSTRTRYPSLLSFDVSKCDAGTRSFANLTSSPLSIPCGSARTPLRSITAIVLSLDKIISSVSG